MNKVLILLMLALPLISCGGKTAEEQLHGTWSISKETVDMMAAEAGAMATDEMKEAMGKLSMTFSKAGKVEVSAPDPKTGKFTTTSGSFSVTKSEGNTVTLEMDVDGKKETEVFTVDGDEMSFEENGQTMKWARK